MTHVIVCAANYTNGIPPCTRRDDHLPTCPGDPCTGCLPREAVHGYLCRRHYEHVEDAHAHHRALLILLADGERAQSPVSSATTVPGPRIPLAALRLDLDAISRLYTGAGHAAAATWVVTVAGAMQALRYARAVHTAQLRHPVEPRTERLHRVRCGSCHQITVVTDPPALAGGDTTLRCVSCGWTTRDQDHAEAAAYVEARIRSPYPKTQTPVNNIKPGGLEQLAGIAALAKALG